jgi:tRNA-specific 2-thiouridylase
VKTIFIGMSGGIDSSYAAYLLKAQGYRVIGFTFDLLSKSLRNACNSKTCCSSVTTNRAKRMADKLSIPHYVLNMRDEFERQVVQRFVNEYKVGRTPNPCVLCNKYVKFGAFLSKAIAMGADRIATGHYASIDGTPDGFLLKKGKDKAKDQSYFLYPIRSVDLSHITFPLESYTKDTVRNGFNRLGITHEHLEESQDICFIPGSDYRVFVGQFISSRRGPIVTTEGKQIGDHEGIHFYTIGQRRGVNVPFREPLYVLEIRAGDNAVVVGTKDQLRKGGLVADDVNFLSSLTEGRAHAKVRYRHKEEPCSFSVKDGLLRVAFDRPTSSITPGQSVVLYDEDTVLGGGSILRATIP